MTLKAVFGRYSDGRLVMIPAPRISSPTPNPSQPTTTSSKLSFTTQPHNADHNGRPPRSNLGPSDAPRSLSPTPNSSTSSPNPSHPPKASSKLNFTTQPHNEGLSDTPPRPHSRHSPTPMFHSPTPRSLSPSPKLPHRSASSPQLHRVSRGDLRDLLFLTPSFPVKGIFDIGPGHFDVVLEEKQISWSPISRSSHAKGEQYPKMIKIRDVFAVQILRIQRAGQESGGHPRGVSIFVVRPKKGVANGLTWEEITLESTNEGCCQEWFQAILHLLNAFNERPKRLKIFLDSMKSEKAKQVYDHKVKTLFHFARMKTDVMEVNSPHQVQDAIDAMDFSDIDGVVCMGGDAITNEAVHGLLQRAQRDAGISIFPDTPMAKCRIPLGIIPTGLFNVVAHSTQGISHAVTATLHIILGHIQPVDVCSMYTEEGFLRFGFSVMYGFGSDCLRRAVKSQNVLKSKSAEYAVAKSLVKLRSYECEVSYLPLEKERCNIKVTDKDLTTCLKGCKVCGHAPDLTHLVNSTPIPLRPKDSPLALRKLSATHRPSLTALGANPNTNPCSSPGPSPVPVRRAMGASVPSIPMIAWSGEPVESTSEECLVLPKKKNGKDFVRSIFKRGSENSSAPNSRPTSAAWEDIDTSQMGVPGRQSIADSAQRNSQNVFTIGAGDQLGVPTVHVTKAPGSQSDLTDAQRGIGILPTGDNSQSQRSREDWLKFQDTFLSIGILSLPNRSQLVPRGLAPSCHLADGRADLVLVRKVNRKEFRKFLQQHGNDDDQFDFPFVWKHQVKAVQIRPLLSNDDLSSNKLEKQMKLLTWNVDMELVRADFIELRVHRQLLAVFGEGILDDEFPTTSCRCL